MSRLQRRPFSTLATTLSFTLSFAFCVLLAGCGGTNSGAVFPAPYPGQTSTSGPNSSGTPTTNTPCCGPAQTTPAVQVDPSTPTPAPPQCYQYQETGGGKTRSVYVTVPYGCVLVADSYAGNLAGHDWTGGAVLAAPAGTYSGSLTDGSYMVVATDKGPQAFCHFVQVLHDNNWALSNQWPLPGWPPCN